MYLKSIRLENTGPIATIDFDLPFINDLPQPLLLVGPNGSGKTTVLSFIVNALVAFKQHVFEDAEVEKGKVYRVRSRLSIRGGANYFHAAIEFENQLKIMEWQLDRTRGTFERDLGFTSVTKDWTRIEEHEFSHFDVSLGEFRAPHRLKALLDANCTLYFPSDRFEPPDWLNSENLSNELKFPNPPRIQGKTPRRIFARNRLKPILEWILALVLDMNLQDHVEFQSMPGGPNLRMKTDGRTTRIVEAVIAVLAALLTAGSSESLKLNIGDRNSRIIGAAIFEGKTQQRFIPDLQSLSAGESALFCLFASIIQDADLAGIFFNKTDELRGVVVVDEVDLHLHLQLQYEVLPKLMRMFPRIQFILTVHAPLVVLGMANAYGHDGLNVCEMPSGLRIDPERYTEFLHAIDVLSQTKSFEDQVLARVNSQKKQVLLVEGKSDMSLLITAWSKLKPGILMPFDIIPCGTEPSLESRSGGAEMLRRCLEFLVIASNRRIIALFDNDRMGNEQFKGVNSKSFVAGIDLAHKRHATKDAHAFLLPIPPGREKFVTIDNIGQRYLSIEHYFSDDVIRESHLMGSRILGTEVFEIVGDKCPFAERAKELDQTHFNNFALIFDRIEQLT